MIKIKKFGGFQESQSVHVQSRLSLQEVVQRE